MAGIGGGGYFVYYDARTHRVFTIDGREKAPAADTKTLFIDPATGQPLDFPVAVTSGLSVGVPGTLMTWQRAIASFGRFGLADDLRPAEQLARRGFVIDAQFREDTRENASRFAQFGSTRKLFLPGGQLPAVGARPPQSGSRQHLRPHRAARESMRSTAVRSAATSSPPFSICRSRPERPSRPARDG